MSDEHKVISRLIDYLNANDQKIAWRRSCWKDYKSYMQDDIVGRLDTEFVSTYYTGGLFFAEIELGYNVSWDTQSSHFSMRFTKYSRIGLKPKPDTLTIFSHNPYNEEKETFGHLPIFQARYQTLFALHFEEARNAMLDFVENGEKLASYFVNMQDESKAMYKKLIDRVRECKDVKEVVRIG
jgi:hypothetical protein